MLHHSFQMEHKFQQATSIRLVPATSLVVDRRYPILRGHCAESRYGPTVIFRLAQTDNTIINICLPKRYADVITDEDLNSLNSGSETLDLVSKGMCQNALVLQMEKRSARYCIMLS